MKRRFTILKAASVMFAAVLLGTSCQKQAITPTASEENNKSQLTTSLAAREGEGESKYELTDMSGRSAGVLVLYNNNGYAELEMMVRTSFGGAQDIYAGLFDKNGDKIVRLAGFNTQTAKDQPFGNELDRMYISTTSPVINLQTGEQMYAKEFPASGYKIAVFDQSGAVVATGAIQ